MNYKNRALLILCLVILVVLVIALFELTQKKEMALISAHTVIQSCDVRIKNEYGEMVSLEIEALNELRDCLASSKIVKVDRVGRGPYQGVDAAIHIVFLEPNTRGTVNIYLGESSIVVKEGIIYEIIDAQELIRKMEELFGVDAGIDEFEDYKPI